MNDIYLKIWDVLNFIQSVAIGIIITYLLCNYALIKLIDAKEAYKDRYEYYSNKKEFQEFLKHKNDEK